MKEFLKKVFNNLYSFKEGVRFSSHLYSFKVVSSIYDKFNIRQNFMFEVCWTVLTCIVVPYYTVVNLCKVIVKLFK